jgi:anti-anti-sigma regulatory factor/anti-sigma regulatory factor (Ser/Thr protein kinase)
MNCRLVPPTSLDESTFERLMRQMTGVPATGGGRVTIDLEHLRFIDPYGMVGLLALARHLRARSLEPVLLLPRSDEVMKYLDRMDFSRHAQDLCAIDLATLWPEGEYSRSSHSDVLLEITPITRSEDIHYIVSRVRERAQTILSANLHYEQGAIDGFVVALSEVCQNIPEHSQDTGYVAIQKYFYGRRLGKNLVKIAVMDLGIGFRASLAPKYAGHYKAWSDVMALRLAIFQGASRYDDPGRGQGLNAVRRFVERWRGKLMIRSGSVRVGVVPPWDRSADRQTGLPPFPGTQVSIVLPELSGDERPAPPVDARREPTPASLL